MKAMTHTSTEQAEALRLADDCEESATHWVHEIDTRAKAAKMLRAQHARIAELESQLEAIGAGGVEPLRKGFVRLTDVLARLEQGFGANSAPVTTIKRHFEMQAAPMNCRCINSGLTLDCAQVNCRHWNGGILILTRPLHALNKIRLQVLSRRQRPLPVFAL